LDDAAKSVNRFYVSNFQDKGRQEAIDMLLKEGTITFSAGSDLIKYYLSERIAEYTRKSEITIFCGTFNLNGKLPTPEESLVSWLNSKLVNSPDIVVIGVQELIQLTAGEYISADTNKLRLVWEAELLESINSQRSTKYVILRSLHLVALGLFVFVLPEMIHRIRAVETCSIKVYL
jgi:hypothetical protein